ncbi:MAG: translation initiation factor IF-2, partial [Prolixibacteraceae bacterium]|nr:translation initiation factor IF-2 [Prolixibacteraceae bacterium]
MAAGTGTKRLGKVAREFNVGISTMVEFLTKKGYHVDSNPNAKIDDDQYVLLQKEYSSDISLKKESEKINLRVQRHQKNETITIDDIDQADADDDYDDDDIDDDADENVLRVTDSNTKKTVTVTQKKSKPADEIVSHAPKSEVKIVGKIDLDRKPKPAQPEAAKDNAPAEASVQKP